jgi:hypothetical protein
MNTEVSPGLAWKDAFEVFSLIGGHARQHHRDSSVVDNRAGTPDRVYIRQVAVFSRVMHDQCRYSFSGASLSMSAIRLNRAEAVTRKKSPNRALWQRIHARDCIHNCATPLTTASRERWANCSDSHQGAVHDIMDSLQLKGRPAERAAIRQAISSCELTRGQHCAIHRRLGPYG